MAPEPTWLGGGTGGVTQAPQDNIYVVNLPDWTFRPSTGFSEQRAAGVPWDPAWMIRQTQSQIHFKIKVTGNRPESLGRREEGVGERVCFL